MTDARASVTHARFPSSGADPATSAGPATPARPAAAADSQALLRRLLALLELAGVAPGLACAEVDASGRLASAGPGLAELAGRPAADLAGRPFASLFTSSSAAALAPRLRDRRTAREGFVLDAALDVGGVPREVRLLAGRAGDGWSVVLVDPRPGAEPGRGAPRRPGGDLDGWLAGSDWPAVLVAGGVVRAANAAARRLLRTDPVGRAADDLAVAEDVLVWRAALRGAAEGRARRVGLALQRGSAPPAGVEADLQPVEHDGRPAALALLRPEAERRDAPPPPPWLARASHDMRSPLVAATGYLEMIAEGRLGPVTAAQGDAVARARRALERADRIAAGVLSFSAAAGGGARRVPCALEAAVIESFDGHREDAARRRVTLVAEPGAPAPRALADPDDVARIVDNLVANATRHGREGGTVRVAWGESRDGRCVLEVRDDGPGMSEQDRAAAFEPFRRGRAAAAAGTPGHGLGLATVRELARRNDATVELESAPGQGTRVVVRFAAAGGDAGVPRRPAS